MNTVSSMVLGAALFTTIAIAQPAAACSPAVVSARTDFPAAAQDQRKHGAVRVAITLQDDGRAQNAVLVRSSGHSVLDQAALQSVERHWRFDVSKCSTAELATARSVDVVFRRPAGVTLSGTVNRNFRNDTRHAAADANCHVTRVSSDTKIFACKDESTGNLASK